MIKFDDVLARFESATSIERYTGVCQILVTIEHTLGAEDRATVYAYLEEWFREVDAKRSYIQEAPDGMQAPMCVVPRSVRGASA